MNLLHFPGLGIADGTEPKTNAGGQKDDSRPYTDSRLRKSGVILGAIIGQNYRL